MGCGQLFILACSGCSAAATNLSKYVPSDSTARDALESALTAWKQGKRAVPVEGTSPKVELYDIRYTNKRPLKNFEILGVVPTGDGPKAFDVRIVLENPTQELKARYVILGADPLCVFSSEDYDSVGHWEHHMDAKDLSGTKAKQ
jgi:hypothetical protein